MSTAVVVSNGAPVIPGTGGESFAPDRFAASRAVDCHLELPVGRLTPGAYLLTLQATRGTRRTPPRDVRFVVR
jgi:hypothetical protein